MPESAAQRGAQAAISAQAPAVGAGSGPSTNRGCPGAAAAAKGGGSAFPGGRSGARSGAGPAGSRQSATERRNPREAAPGRGRSGLLDRCRGSRELLQGRAEASPEAPRPRGLRGKGAESALKKKRRIAAAAAAPPARASWVLGEERDFCQGSPSAERSGFTGIYLESLGAERR